MTLAKRVARHRRQRRTIASIRDQRTSIPKPRFSGSLLEFVPRVSKRMRSPDHLRPLADAFEQGMRNPGSVEQCFSVPVRHGKTTLIQHAIAWMLAKNPEEQILYLSYALKLAAKQTSKAKELAIRAGVPVVGRSAAEWYTKAGGMVKAAGIGGQLTGEGFTKIIIDDPHKNRAEAESRLIREGVIDAAMNDVFTRQDPRGTDVFVVHARWVPNDLIGVLSRSGFEYTNLPALDDRGEPLAPWLFSKERLEKLFKFLGPYVSGSLYQGNPRPRGGTLFGSPTLSRQREPSNYRVAIGIDLARSSSTRQDHNAAVVMRKDLDTDYIDILHALRALGTITDKSNPDETLVDEGFIRQLVPVLHAYPGAELVMYAARIETALVKLLSRELTEAMGRTVEVIAMEITGDKYLRAQPYAAAYNKGRVRLPGRESLDDDLDEFEDDDVEREDWISAFLAEHAEFTGVKGQGDDWVDAAAAAFDYLEQEQGTSLAEAMAAVGRIE